MSVLTSNITLTGARYGNTGTVGEQFPSVPIQPTPVTSQTITLNRLESTAQTFNPTVVLNTASVISLNRLESTAQIYLPTVILAGGVQTITLNLVGSTSQTFLPTISLASGVVDTSDILDRYARKRSESKQEEEIAAQLLKARRKRPEVEQSHRKLINWKKLIYEAIYGAETVEELEAIEIPTAPVDSPEVVAAILAELEQQREVRRTELKLKMEEAAFAASKLQSEIDSKLQSQRKAIEDMRALQKQLIERHSIAVTAAREAETQAFLELQEAERKAQEFTRQRNNRIKRLKALMWLAKLDL